MLNSRVFKIAVISILYILSAREIHAHSLKINLKIGEQAPDFIINNPEGKPISLSSLRGNVVLIDFWASWCMPCRMTNPDLVQLYNNFNKIGFEIFSVSLDAKKEPWVNAIKNDKLTWPSHGSELVGWESKIATRYGVESIPATFLIDEDGIIIGKDLDEYEIEKKLNYYFFTQVNMYPHLASSKIYFTDKTKYQIEDKDGNIVLKNKSDEADITGLLPGEYTVKFDKKTETFIKTNLNQPFVSFYPTNVADHITLSRPAEHEVLNTRGKVIRKGKETTIINVSDLPQGIYYLNIEGDIFKFFKK